MKLHITKERSDTIRRKKMKCHICNTDNSLNECNHYHKEIDKKKLENDLHGLKSEIFCTPPYKICKINRLISKYKKTKSEIKKATA